ncbi:hypothetical protein VP01_2768g1 [Puccinia sorghi]|uniref:Uncharacterized protein n=1 Tax=Puccinia sorghi TaxID=27349 RepID=A0A0L6V2V6_9BASI|nr:hypothetical protein VP01_2768g1 [Puccinia sorghi]
MPPVGRGVSSLSFKKTQRQKIDTVALADLKTGLGENYWLAEDIFLAFQALVHVFLGISHCSNIMNQTVKLVESQDAELNQLIKTYAKFWLATKFSSFGKFILALLSFHDWGFQGSNRFVLINLWRFHESHHWSVQNHNMLYIIKIISPLGYSSNHCDFIIVNSFFILVEAVTRQTSGSALNQMLLQIARAFRPNIYLSFINTQHSTNGGLTFSNQMQTRILIFDFLQRITFKVYSAITLTIYASILIQFVEASFKSQPAIPLITFEPILAQPSLLHPSLILMCFDPHFLSLSLSFNLYSFLFKLFYFPHSFLFFLSKLILWISHLKLANRHCPLTSSNPFLELERFVQPNSPLRLGWLYDNGIVGVDVELLGVGLHFAGLLEGMEGLLYLCAQGQRGKNNCLSSFDSPEKCFPFNLFLPSFYTHPHLPTHNSSPQLLPTPIEFLPESLPISTPCNITLIRPPLRPPRSSGPPLRPPDPLGTLPTHLAPCSAFQNDSHPPDPPLIPTQPNKSPEDTFLCLIWSASAFRVYHVISGSYC